MISKLLTALNDQIEEVEELSFKNSYNIKKLRFHVKKLKTLARNPYRLSQAKLFNDDARFFSKMLNVGKSNMAIKRNRTPRNEKKKINSIFSE